MIDERFSKQAFEAVGWNTEASRVLCGQLDAEVHVLLMDLLKPAMQDIVNRLNSMGHALVDVSQELGDDIHYRQPTGTSLTGRYKMLLAADLVVTVGYPRSQRLELEGEAD